MKKLIALGIIVGLAGIAACEPRDEPAFDDDFQFQEPPPATPAPAPVDTPMDPMMDPTMDPTMQDTLHQQPGTPPGTPPQN
jgi:hypothetical protein